MMVINDVRANSKLFFIFYKNKTLDDRASRAPYFKKIWYSAKTR